MLVDKDLVVILWHLGHRLIADKDLVITWFLREMCDFNHIMCTWWSIYDEFYEMNVCMIYLMINWWQDYMGNGAMSEYIGPTSQWIGSIFTWCCEWIYQPHLTVDKWYIHYVTYWPYLVVDKWHVHRLTVVYGNVSCNILNFVSC